jgi:hypothetical protein
MNELDAAPLWLAEDVHSLAPLVVHDELPDPLTADDTVTLTEI